MKLGAVVSASNTDKLYYDFIPTFINTWKSLFPEIIVKVILIANSLPEELEIYKNNIVIFDAGISSAFQSQFIRLLYPALVDTKDGVLITDIDMIPMNRDYYVRAIENINNDKFISYRNVLLNLKEIAMCYNIATPIIWGEIFGIKNLEDVKNRLISEYSVINYDGQHGGKGWTTDQTRLYKIIMDWNTKTGRYKILNDQITRFHRLRRMLFNNLNDEIINNIMNGVYIDYHMHRPYMQNKRLVDEITSYLNKKVACFISIPKCASKTILEMFSLGKNRDNDYEDDNHYVIYENHQRLKVLENRYNLDNLFIFTFVRNPYDRIASWYYYHRYLEPYKSLSLEEWIESGCKTHFKIQNATDWVKEDISPLLQYNFIDSNTKIDFIGKMETFEKDVKYVIDKLNEMFKKNKINKNIIYKSMKINTSNKPNIELSKKSKEVIYNLFKKDFEFFGYSK